MSPAPPLSIGRRAPAPLSAAQKAAIVLAALPRETAAAIVAEVADAHLKSFVRAVSEMKSAPAEARLAIVQEFIAEVLRRRDEMPGGSSEAQRILSEITDPARAGRVLGSGAAEFGDAAELWRRAAGQPVDRLVLYLQKQRLPAVAAILSSLPAATAAEILAKAPESFGRAVVAALARFRFPDAETSRAIAAAFEQELLDAAAPESAEVSASESATAIFDQLPSRLRDGLMVHLDAEDAPAAAALRRALTTFEDLPQRMTEAGVAALMRAAERDTLMRALKHGEASAPATVGFLLANISKRMADQFREDLAALAAPAPEEGEAAQRALIATIKTLARSGEIKLKPAT